MKSVTICALVALAIVLTVAIFPASSWVFRNQVDLVTKQKVGNDSGDLVMVSEFMPSWLLDPNTYDGKEPAQKLMHALLSKRGEREEELARYAQDNPNDPLGWAVIVRMTCMMGTRFPDDPKKKPYSADDKTHDQGLIVGIEACIQGERLEPNNGYFPLMRAEFNMELSRLAEMRSALHTAATKATYNSHVRDEGERMEQALLLAKGYRGEMVRTGVDASILLPDFSHIKALGRYLNRNGDLEEKRDLVQVDNAISHGEDTAIGMLVAYAALRLTIHSPIPYNSVSGSKVSDDEYRELARGFDSKLAAAKVLPPSPSTAETYQTLERLVKATKTYIDSLPAILAQTDGDDKALVYLVARTVAPYITLTALLFCIPFLPAAWGFAQVRSETFRKMMPHLVCLPISVLALLLVHCNDCSPLPLFGLLFGTAQLALACLRLSKTPASISTAVIALLVLIAVGTSDLMAENGGQAVQRFWVAACTAGFCIGLASLPWLLDIEKRQRIATVAGVVLALLPIVGFSYFGTDGTGLFSSLAFGLAYGMVWKNRAGETPRFVEWSTFTVFILLLLGAGAATIWRLMDGGLGVGIGAACLLGIFAAALYTGKPIRSVKNAACTCLILFSVSYMLSTGIEIRENQRQSSSKTKFMDEADNIRKLAGVQKTVARLEFGMDGYRSISRP